MLLLIGLNTLQDPSARLFSLTLELLLRGRVKAVDRLAVLNGDFESGLDTISKLDALAPLVQEWEVLNLDAGPEGGADPNQFTSHWSVERNYSSSSADAPRERVDIGETEFVADEVFEPSLLEVFLVRGVNAARLGLVPLDSIRNLLRRVTDCEIVQVRSDSKQR